MALVCETVSTVVVQLPQDPGRRLSEQAIVDVARAMSVAFCSFGHRHQSSHSRCSRMTAMIKLDVAKHDQRTQRPFGQIIRRRDKRIIQKDEPLVLVLHNSLLQSQRLFVAHRKCGQLQQAFLQPDFFGCLLGLTRLSLVAQAMKATAVSDELANSVEDPECRYSTRIQFSNQDQ